MDDPGTINLSAEDLERMYGRAEEAEAAGDTEEAARLREEAERAQERAEAAEARAERAEAQEQREEARAEKLERQAEQAERLGNEERAERLERMAERAETRAERAEARADAAQEQATTAQAEAAAATAAAEDAESPPVEDPGFDPRITTTVDDLLGDQAGVDPDPEVPSLEDLSGTGVVGNLDEIRDVLDDITPLDPTAEADPTASPIGGSFADLIPDTGPGSPYYSIVAPTYGEYVEEGGEDIPVIADATSTTLSEELDILAQTPSEEPDLGAIEADVETTASDPGALLPEDDGVTTTIDDSNLDDHPF